MRTLPVILVLTLLGLLALRGDAFAMGRHYKARKSAVRRAERQRKRALRRLEMAAKGAVEKGLMPFTIPGEDSRIELALDRKTFELMAERVNEVLLDYRSMRSAQEKGERHQAQYMSVSANVGGKDGVWLQMECNPNVYPDQFQAQVYVKVRSGNMEVTSEIPLAKLVQSMKEFKAEHLI